MMNRKPIPSKTGEFSHSFNCVDVYMDEPGDTTVRPCRPSMLAHAMAERAKIQAAVAAREAAVKAAKNEKTE
jgi:hypothetical protein